MGYNEMLSAMDMEIQTPYFKDAFDKMPEYVKAMMRALLRGLELVTNDGVDDFNRVSIDFNEYVYEVGARRYPFQSVKELAKAALARIFVEFDMWLFGAWIDLWDDDHLYTDKKGRTRIYYMFTKRFASMMLHCKDTVMEKCIREPSKFLAYFNCGERTILCGIDGKVVRPKRRAKDEKSD